MSPRRLAGVLIHTAADRFAAMRRFYVDTLELPVRSDRDGFVNFEWGAMRLTVAVHSGITGGTLDPNRIMMNLEVPDIHEEHRRLLGASVSFSRPPEQEAWGGWVATFSDPDGNTIQLLELPETSAAS